MTHYEYLIKTEEYVEKRFKNVIIISQVTISYEKFESILLNFKKILAHYSSHQKNIIRSMWKMAPKTCLYLTVTFAIYQYDGNFWGKFKEAISLLNEHYWKRSFLKQLLTEDLIVFDQTSSQKYINNILGHASLPKNNVKSFITNVLIKAVEYNLDADEIVFAFNENGNNANVKTNGIYKSVQDFIKLNNHVSNDVLSRCLEVWREHNTPFYENYRYFLPDHILKEFDQFVEGLEEGYLRKATFFKRPLLLYSPENQNVFIDFPIQRLSIGKHQDLKWIVKSDGKDMTITLNKSIIADYNELEFAASKKERELEVKPQTYYQVYLIADDEVKGEWHFNLTDVIFFNGKTFEQERKEIIPEKEIIAIIHEDIKHVIENGKNPFFMKPLFNGWSGYYETEINVKEMDTLNFPNQTIYFNPDRIKFELIGDCYDNVKSDSLLFHIIPKVIIKNQGIDTDIRKWNIRLTHNWTNQSVSSSIVKLIDQGFDQKEQFTISVESLMEAIGIFFGKFTISLTGLLGQDYKMVFSLLRKGDLNLSIHETVINTKVLGIESAKDIDFSSETDVDIKMSKSNFWNIDLTPTQQRIKGTILNRSNYETMNVTIYSSDVAVEVKCGNIFHPIGETFNRVNFKLNENFILLDLENPKLATHKDAVTVIIYELLQSGEKAQKSFQLRTGRKHLIDLGYFDGINDTYRTRVFFIKVPECSFDKKLLILETYWQVSHLEVINRDGEVIVTWDSSFPPESVEIKVWRLNQYDFPYYQQVVKGNETECLIKNGSLHEGYFLVEISEHHSNDFFSALFNQGFPSEQTNKTLIFSNFEDDSIANYSLTKWLLLEDEQGQEYEWGFSELEKLLKTIYKSKNLMLDLLVEDYDSCCDFGIQNLDNLLELFELNSEDTEFQKFLYKIIGFQEWDINSFQEVIKQNLFETGKQAGYTPANLTRIYSMSQRELFLANQRRTYTEKLIKGFSLEHAFITHLYNITANNEYRDKVQSYVYRESGNFNQITEEMKVKKIIPKEFVLTINSRKIANEGSIKNLPYLIGVSACLTAALLYYDSVLSEDERVSIRKISQWMIQEHDKWYLYDLIYWKNRFNEFENREKASKERKRKYEHPSFAWKR
jgi:hypothetical protein